jgi:hypothetical protein
LPRFDRRAEYEALRAKSDGHGTGRPAALDVAQRDLRHQHWISHAERIDVLHKTHSYGKTRAVHSHVTRRLRFWRYSFRHINMLLHAKPADAKGV